MDIIMKLEEKLGKDNIKLNEPMSKHTSFKTGGNADIFIKVHTIEDLKNILEISRENNVPIFVFGNGTNILVTDKGIRGIVCKIEISKFEISYKDEFVFVTCGSGNKNAEVSQKLLNEEIEGFEFAYRNSRNYRWSYKNECWCIWKGNEGYSIFKYIY